ncbi:sugar phosphate nucleotidyltransferase [Alicyclobacillus pomorum]|jgi:mannose-1-phosphate guanylyltransferase|uniref:sugar phosphate nucleotidyltransferase n=1 Tax=Alicyclobacillus pomorum TaxID=204470 RepID=UPI000417F6A9|nr:sugar phosphate nucleotidyltransferase [Alicyclobacillus pomorum]
MKLILLSGGSGKRLWPMSNDSRSKQFLKVLSAGDNQKVSMLQRVWRQLGNMNLHPHAYVCASKAQWEVITSQIGDIPFIQEPSRRDTFPAIALASLYLSDVVGCSGDEVVVVVPVDHFVDDEYFSQVVQLEAALSASGADLALLGVQPTAPTSKFGYIRVKPSETTGDWMDVDSFVEKPPTELAERLIAEGALWNCGVFCFRLEFIQSVLAAKGYPTTYKALLEQFDALPKRSFDYEVVEQTDSIVARGYSGTWKDLGTWESLSEEMADPFAGNGEAVACENTHIINELDIPVVAMGLKDVMVVTTPDGILVADKKSTSKLKDVIGHYEGRPMYEERRWGSYRVLDVQKLEDGTEVLTKSIELLPGHNISYQKHFKRSEIWTIVEGTGELALDNRIVPVVPGDVIRIYAEQWHAIRATTRLKFIEVQRGSELVEEDIVRRYLDWEDICTHCRSGIGIS